MVQHASLAQQRHVLTTLGRVREAIVDAGLTSPAVIVVGDVLRGIAVAGLAQPRTQFGT